MMSVNRWYVMEIKKKLNITDPWANLIISTEFIDIDILQNDMILSVTVLIFSFLSNPNFYLVCPYIDADGKAADVAFMCAISWQKQ